jgi:CheY-like chemotaxis protein
MKKEMHPISGIIVKWVDVLLVEDDDDCRAMIASVLSIHDCLVRGVATAQEARVAAMDGIPDVVISDLQLASGTPGWTLARALRDDARTAHVGLIAITGSVEPWPTVVSPFDAYLRKPVEARLLVGLVKQLGAVSRATRQAGHRLAR